MITIKSKRFVLRSYERGDEKSLQKNVNDKDIYKYTLRIPYPYTIKVAKKWISYCRNELKKKTPKEISFAIDVDGDVVGAVGLHNIEKNHKAEIGYWIGKKHWNRGLMTKAVKLVTNFGFNKLKLRRIYANVFSVNRASAKVLEKNEYKLEGKMKNYHIKDEKLIDALLYAKSK